MSVRIIFSPASVPAEECSHIWACTEVRGQVCVLMVKPLSWGRARAGRQAQSLQTSSDTQQHTAPKCGADPILEWHTAIAPQLAQTCIKSEPGLKLHATWD